MRDQLIRYVDLLFAGVADVDDIKQEILQNTLDRYDDLVSQGKKPEAAYSLVIAGIGDFSEILNPPIFGSSDTNVQTLQPVPVWKKILRPIGIALGIIAMIPLLLLIRFGITTTGLCTTIAIACVSAIFLILTEGTPHSAKMHSRLRKTVESIVFVFGLAAYLIVSFISRQWSITWLIFPIIGAVNGLCNAIIDLKEAV